MQVALRTSVTSSTTLTKFKEICRTVLTSVAAYPALVRDRDTSIGKGQKDHGKNNARITADAIGLGMVSLAVRAAMFAGPGMVCKTVSQPPTIYKAQGLG